MARHFAYDFNLPLIYARKIPQKVEFLIIPQEVVFLQIFLNLFKSTNYSLYDTTGSTIYGLYFGQ